LRGNLWRVLTLCVFILLPLAGVAAVRAQDGTAAYTSPSYGYELTWDDTWQVVEESSSGGYDLLHLTNGVSDVYIEGYVGDDGDPATCLDGSQALLAGDADPDAVPIMTADDGTEMAGQEDGVAYAIFDLSGITEEGDVPYAAYVECRALRPGVAVLAITAFAPLDEWDAQADAIVTLFGGLYLPEGTSGASVDPDQFAAFETSILDDLNGFWTDVFAAAGETYEAPQLVIFDAPVQSACGDAAPQEIGPFYCPADLTVYLDQVDITESVLPYGEFVVSVVIAHEVGHHVQNLLGLEGCTDKGCGGRGGSLAVELQADCFAGAWAQHAGKTGAVEPGAIEDTVIALSAFFGDPPDAQPTDPDAHGPGALRTWWFLKGYYESTDTCFGDQAA
jgi:hypothetical protein